MNAPITPPYGNRSDPVLLNELAEAFTDNGISCRVCDNWTATLEILEDWQPDLIVLDQRLGSVDTLLLPALRQLTSVPVLFLTGNRNEADRVIGLELGADDFLLKPISGQRIAGSGARASAPGEPVRQAGGRRMADRGGRAQSARAGRLDGAADLDRVRTAASARRHAGGGTGSRDAVAPVLRRPFQAEDRSLDNLVHQIRRKFGRSGAGEIIASVRNVGYVFRGYPEN